jgi:glycosyl transferase family 2
VKLRIVTATRGESAYWPETVASIAAAAPGAEHVVVGPAARVAALRAAAPRATVVAEPGAGLYPAINYALRAVPGDWTAFTWLNDDDVLRAPGFGGAAGGPAADVRYGRVELIDSRSKRIGELPVARRGADFPALLAQGVMPLAQPGTIIRRSVWEKLGGLDERYRNAGDLDIFVRALAEGFRFAFHPGKVAAFRLHAGQLSKRRSEVEAETARALAPLAGTPHTRAALWRFRLANAGVYAERIRRHGLVSMRHLYDRTE